MPDSETPATGEQFEATPVEGQGGQTEVSDIGNALLRTEGTTQIPVTTEADGSGQVGYSTADSSPIAEPLNNTEPKLSGNYGLEYKPVEDVDKARYLAEVEDSGHDRSEAASARVSADMLEKVGRRNEDLLGLTDEIEKGNLKRSDRRAFKKAHHQRRTDLLRDLDELTQSPALTDLDRIKLRSLRDWIDNPYMRFEGDRAERMSKDDRRYANERSAKADKLGYWAELLYDNPPSDEYKQAHPGVDFSPAGMIALQDQIASYKRTETTLRRQFDLETRADDSAPKNSMERTLTNLSRLIDQDPGIVKKLMQGFEPGSDPTLAQLWEKAQSSAGQKIEPVQAKINELEGVLEYIQNGGGTTGGQPNEQGFGTVNMADGAEMTEPKTTS